MVLCSSLASTKDCLSSIERFYPALFHSPDQYLENGTFHRMMPDYVIDEMQRNGETFRRKKLCRVMSRYVTPVMMLALFLQSTGILA